MKKMFSCILLLSMFILTPFTVYADDMKEYSISKYGVTMSFSSEWVVATKDFVPEVDSYHGIEEVRKLVVDGIQKYDYEIDAVHNQSYQRFVFLIRNSKIEYPTVSDSINLDQLYKSIQANSPSSGVELYRGNFADFVIFQKDKLMRAITYSNGIALCFDYVVYDINLDTTIQWDFKSILNTVKLPAKKEPAKADSTAANEGKKPDLSNGAITSNQPSINKDVDTAIKETTTSSKAASSKETSSLVSSSVVSSSSSEASSSTLVSSELNSSEIVSSNNKTDSKTIASFPIILTIVGVVIVLAGGAVVAILLIRKKKNR